MRSSIFIPFMAISMVVAGAVCVGGCVATALKTGPAGGMEGKPQKKEIQVVVDVRDGSHLIGVCRQNALPFRCALGALKIPMADIRRLTMLEDREQGTIILANGDKLTGVPDCRVLKIKTILGDIAVGMTDVLELAVLPEAIGPGLGQGLMLYYPFDRDAGRTAPDASGRSHDGTVNDARWTPDGRIGGAYDFSGNGTPYVECQPKGLAGARAITVSAWIRSFGDPADMEYVIKDHETVGNNRFVFMGLQKTGVSPDNICGSTLLITKDSDGLPAIQTIYLNQQAKYFRDGAWHHVAMTWDGATAKWYVEGQFDSQTATPAGRLAYTDDRRLFIGNGYSFGSLHENFNGLIDEVMIYNRALSNEEVCTLYARGAGRDVPGGERR